MGEHRGVGASIGNRLATKTRRNVAATENLTTDPARRD